MKVKELKEKIAELGLLDDDVLFIRIKIEAESRASTANITSELCIESSGMIYEIKTLLREVY